MSYYHRPYNHYYHEYPHYRYPQYWDYPYWYGHRYREPDWYYYDQDEVLYDWRYR